MLNGLPLHRLSRSLDEKYIRTDTEDSEEQRGKLRGNENDTRKVLTPMGHEQFTQIYLPFSGKMYALAYNLLRNRDEARDCVQDVYAELWNKRDTIEPDKPPLPFALTMVRNNCLDR